MLNSFKCPKCSREIKTSGVLTIDGKTMPVFQCDECTVVVTMFEAPLTVAFTFGVYAGKTVIF